jgi:hypothetical protein
VLRSWLEQHVLSEFSVASGNRHHRGTTLAEIYLQPFLVALEKSKGCTQEISTFKSIAERQAWSKQIVK